MIRGSFRGWFGSNVDPFILYHDSWKNNEVVIVELIVAFSTFLVGFSMVH